MDKPTYPFKQFEKELLFEFDSISQTRSVRKVIAYECIDDVQQIFNLALLDILDDGTVDDLVVSNNQDMEKILATVIATVPVFFSKFPEATVFFQGSSSARTRLYRIVINKYWQRLNEIYAIWGELEDSDELKLFEPNQLYTGFYFKKK